MFRAAVGSALIAGALCLTGNTAGAQPIHIAAFGDSNTAAFMVGEDKGYPADLQQILRAKGYDVIVTNGGVSGAKSADGVKTIDTLVPPGTDIAIVFFGRNDKRWGVEETVTRANIDTILTRLKARHIVVLLAGYWAYDFSDIARIHGAAYYPQFFDGVAVGSNKLPQYKLTFDPLQHLNAAGYQVVAAHIAPAVEALVKQVEAQRKTPPRASASTG